MSVTREQSDVYLLHMEIMICGVKAMDHSAHAHIQRSRGKCNDALDWAMDYQLAMPHDPRDKELVHRDHYSKMPRFTPAEDKRLEILLKRFYGVIDNNGVYRRGVWLLMAKGE